jgi:hypothetical protein
MAGAVVTDLDLCEAPNDNNICGPTTDLAGVYVDDPDTDCDIFETCEPGNPICSALPAGSCPFDVVDEAICQLDVPEEVALFTCPAGSNLGAGALVTDSDLCNAATPAEQCPAGTQLENVWVTDATAANCSVNGLTLLQCPAGTNLAGAVVTDPDLCDAAAPAVQCGVGTALEGIWVDPADTDTCDDLVTKDFKACNTCLLVGVDGVEGREDTTNLLTGINQFTNNNQEQGPEALCQLEDDQTIIDTYNDIVDETVSNSINQNNAKALFSNCLTGSDLPVIIGLDLAVTNFADGDVSILLGNDDGTFGLKTDFPTGNNPEAIAVGDFNADSNLDLAVTNFNDGDVSILLGDGLGSFGPKTDFPTGNNPVAVAVGLFNADSNLDLAVANFADADVSILLGDGLGSFGPKTDFPTGNQPAYIAVGLFNADSNLDLAVTNRSDADVSILLGDGLGSFGPKTDFPTGILPRDVVVGHFNADSNLDLAVANNGDADVSILLGNVDGSFGPKTDFPVGNGPVGIAVGEFDNNS